MHTHMNYVLPIKRTTLPKIEVIYDQTYKIRVQEDYIHDKVQVLRLMHLIQNQHQKILLNSVVLDEHKSM